MADIFVSYTQHDKDVALDLVNYLEKHGTTCFFAPRDIEAGAPYARTLMAAMTECETAIIVCSTATNESEHVLNEIESLVDKKKKLMPFIIEDFEFCDDLSYYLARKQHIIANEDKPQSSFKKVLDALGIIPVEEDTPTDDPEEGKSYKTVFEYIPDRGIMVNPEDHQRNVSFRSDTLVNLFNGIYNDVTEGLNEEEAQRIFFRAGQKSGNNFASRLNEQWSLSEADLISKLRKWCEFDSQVGWGKFGIALDIDENAGTMEGMLSINENFLSDKKSKCHICEFVRGYCTAVISVLCELEVELTCVECPMQNRFKNECKLRIDML